MCPRGLQAPPASLAMMAATANGPMVATSMAKLQVTPSSTARAPIIKVEVTEPEAVVIRKAMEAILTVTLHSSKMAQASVVMTLTTSIVVL